MKLPFKKIDIYIVRKFLVSYVFISLMFIAIAIVIDISEKMDDFINCDATVKQIIFDYYLNFIPHISALLTPLFIFIAVIFFTSKMAYNSEIVAMLSSGISYNRVLVPYLFTGILMCGVMLYVNHWLVPDANKGRIAFEMQYIKNKKWYGYNIHMRLDPRTFISLDRFKYQRNEGFTFSLEHFDTPGPDRSLVYKLDANRITWLPDEEKWKINDYTVWEIDGLNEKYIEGKEFDTVIPMKPEDFEVNLLLKESMDYDELDEFIIKETQKGASNLEFYAVEKHRRSSAAISIIILTLIGATIASRKVRGGTGLHIAFGFALSALYIVFLQFSSTFSTNADLPPVIGTNIPNVIFAILTVFLHRFTPK